MDSAVKRTATIQLSYTADEVASIYKKISWRLIVIRDGRYMPPTNPGYSAEPKAASLAEYTFPTGAAWR